MKILNRTTIGILLTMLVLTSACSDHLFDDLIDNGDTDSEGIGFGTYVTEQADQLYAMGQTRTAAGQTALDSTSEAVLTATSRPMQSNTLDTRLYLHRKALPLMGIHPGTVRTQSSTTTRAASSDIVPTGSDPINFHDSLTIWGSVYDESGNKHRLLFHQTLLKKVRGFRSSVHWPYKNTTNLKSDNKEETVAEWNGKWMNFCALAPAYESLEDLTINEPTVWLKDDVNAHPDLPSFTYKIPEDPRQQRDLLFGISDNIDVQAGPSALGHSEQYPYADTEKEQHLGQDDKVIPMTFRHILTTVRFAQGKMPTNATITRVELHDILNTGTFTPTPGATLPGAWGDLGSSKSDYDIYPNYEASNWAGSENTYIDNDSVLFLLPHTLGSTAKLQVTLKDASDKEHTLTCDLTGDEWLPGYTVTYVITIGEVADDYYLYVAPSATTGQATHDSNSAQTSSFTIHSYHNFKDISESTDGTSADVHHAAKWQVKGFSTTVDGTYSGDNRPDWLTEITGWKNVSGTKGESESITASGTGDNQTVTYSLSAQGYVKPLNHEEILNRNSFQNINLAAYEPDATNTAGKGTTRTPAESSNCYIVNAEGNYQFPTVYGNALGKDKSAFNPDDIFKDHAGRTIEKANIAQQVNYTASEVDVTSTLTSTETESGYTSAKEITEISYTINSVDAKLLWKDTDKDLFKNVNYSTASGGLIVFEVRKDNVSLTPSNAVIGLYGTKTTTVKTVKYKGETADDPITNSSVTASTPELLWAWHIWLTDEVYKNQKEGDTDVDQYYPNYANGSKITSLQDKDGNPYNILPVNLGWVPAVQTFGKYNPREIWVEIEQLDENNSGTKNTIHLRIRQEAYPDLIEGTSTIYQWGSPVAHPMAAPATGGADIVWSNSWWGAGSANTAFWSTTGKTLYDPCPPGFRLPDGTVFTGLSLTGGNITATNSGANLNIWNNGADNSYAELNKGAWGYTTKHTTLTDADRYGPMVYIPASGTWNSVGNSSDESTSFLWTGSYSGTNGINVRLRPQKGSSSTNQDFFLYDEATFPFTIAMPIRPVSSQ